MKNEATTTQEHEMTSEQEALIRMPKSEHTAANQPARLAAAKAMPQSNLGERMCRRDAIRNAIR